MSLDASLRSAGSLVRHRNVLTRAERLGRLKEVEKWNEDKSVFGLPKVANRKLEMAKADKEETAADGTTPAAAPAAGGKAAAPAAGAKGAAPAAGAKGAAPAAAAKGGAPAAKAGAPAAKAAPAAKGKK